MKKSGSGTFLKVMKYIGRYRMLLVMSVVLAGASVILQLYIPNLFGDAIDGIVAKGNVDFDMVGNYLARILVLVIICSAVTFVMNMVNNKLTYKVVQDIRSTAIRRIQELPLSYLDSHSSGDIVSRVIADVDQISDGLLLGFTQLFSGVITIVFTLIFMFLRSVPITLMVVVFTPVSFQVAKLIAGHSFKMFRLQSETRGEQTALVEEMVGSEKTVKAFGYGEKASQRYRSINLRLQEIQPESRVLQQSYESFDESNKQRGLCACCTRRFIPHYGRNSHGRRTFCPADVRKSVHEAVQ